MIDIVYIIISYNKYKYNSIYHIVDMDIIYNYILSLLYNYNNI